MDYRPLSSDPHNAPGTALSPKAPVETPVDAQIVLSPAEVPPTPRAAAAPVVGRGSLRIVLSWLLAALALLLVARVVGPYLVRELQYAAASGRLQAEYDFSKQELEDGDLQRVAQVQQTVSQMVARRIAPSVVHVFTTSGENPAFSSQDGFTLPFRETHGQGSGVVIDDSGHILTNLHVVRNTNSIHVTLSDGRDVPAEIVGGDRLTDLAVIRVKANNLIPADWGDSDQLEVGSLVWAAGSPFGLDQSITFGILSAKHRGQQAGTSFQDFLQTDAAVNPGNSGGPLVDSKGRVVGINTAIVGDTYQGISFAVPSSVAKKVYERIKEAGYVSRGWLGAQLSSVPSTLAEESGLPTGKGALVQMVIEDSRNPSPAQRAGLAPGDVIARFDGQEVSDYTSLIQQISGSESGHECEMEVVRKGERLTLEVVLGERPPEIN
jgi:S1-C subfamily serine protease